MAFSPLKWVKVGDQVQIAGLTECRASLPAAFPDEEACGFGPEICRGGDTIQQAAGGGDGKAAKAKPIFDTEQRLRGRSWGGPPPSPAPAAASSPCFDARGEITDISRLVFVTNSTLAGLLVKSLTLKRIRIFTKPSEMSKTPKDYGCQRLLTTGTRLPW